MLNINKISFLLFQNPFQSCKQEAKFLNDLCDLNNLMIMIDWMMDHWIKNLIFDEFRHNVEHWHFFYIDRDSCLLL